MKNTPPYSQTAVPPFREIEPLQETEVIKIVKSMATKSCEMDVLPTTLLKDNLDHLICLLTKLVNTSLTQGVYAKSWKTAIIRPLLKKTGLELIYSNFRPMSNLSFISKLVEHCMLYRFNEYCDQHSLLPIYQSAYKKFHSCETALIKITNDLMMGHRKQELHSTSRYRSSSSL